MRRQALRKALDARLKAMGKERDKLRSIRDDAEEQIEKYDRAEQALMEAIDALSELV